MENKLIELGNKVTELEERIRDTLVELIKNKLDININSYRRPELSLCRSKSGKVWSIGINYYDLDIVDDQGEEVFGTTITLCYNKDEITLNCGTTGEFMLGSNEKLDLYQNKKYILLGWLCQNHKELKELLDSFDYSCVKEYENLRDELDTQKWELEKQRRIQERNDILNSLKVGNEYSIENDRITVKLIKLTDKRVYFESMFGTQKYYSKDDIVDYIKLGKFKLINGVE